MLLEREAQLSGLASVIEQLDADGGKVVLVRGEAGIGKSSLIAEFVARTEAKAHILFGTCDDLLTPQTLGAFWDVARDEPSIADQVRVDDRRGLQAALLDLLSRSLRPTVLVVEDTQWADEATLDVIRFIGRRIGRTNGVMVLTYRDTEVEHDHPLRQVIGDLPPSNVVRMQVPPLSEEAIGAIIGERSLDIDTVLRQTDGNPLYVTELVSWESDDVPSSIQEMVLARAGRLSDDARELVEVTSVLPGGAKRSLIERVSNFGLTGLSECVQAGLLRSSGDVIGFVHELQRRSVEASLPASRKRALNGRILELLRPEADASRLVHHAREADDVEAIIEFAPIAARAAIAADSRREAAAHFRSLEPLLDKMDPLAAAEVLGDWARQEFYLHNPQALDLAERAVSVHREHGDALELGKALAFASWVNMQHLRTEKALERAEEAVALLEPFGNIAALAFAVSMLAHVTWLLTEDMPVSIAIADRALEIAESSGNAWETTRALIVKGNMAYSIGMAEGLRLLQRAHALAVESGDRDAEVRSLSNMAAMSADFRQIAQATDYARRAIETAARYEMRSMEAETRAMYAEMLLWQGQWSEVENVATAALGTQPSAETIAWRVLGQLQTRRGRREARTALERMWDLAQDADALTVIDPAAGALAEYMWFTGDRDPAWLDRMQQILEEGIGVGNPWPSGAFAFWMWKLGRLDEVPEGTFDMYGWIIRGDVDAAVEFWSEKGLPYEHALALMHGSTDQRLEALQIAEDLQADALASAIRTELTASGVSAPRGRGKSTRDNAAGLTARQSEVLDLLADGMSNADIADQLFLSPRTVENHVAAILLKLDAPNRDAAVATAREQGVLPSI